MKKFFIFIIALLFIIAGNVAQLSNTERKPKVVELSGSGYEIGYQHGKALKSDIREIVGMWKSNAGKAMSKDAELILDEFFAYANFEPDIKKYTPELWEEVRGISEGSGQDFRDILVLNLLDEFWVYVNNSQNHHCSSMGVPAQNGRPAYVAQNMDLENYTDGFQVIMRIEGNNERPEQLILTHAGLIGLNGVNSRRIGLCVNTLMQLKASSKGVPVAFIVRGLLSKTNKKDALAFLHNIPHASGQNYVLGIADEVFDFEASANEIVRYDPKNNNGAVYHTNHPIVNTDVKPWYEHESPASPGWGQLLETSNSGSRFLAVEKRLAKENEITGRVLKETMRSQDHPEHPVCRANRQNGRGFTFASVIFELGIEPVMHMVCGPPDEGEYQSFGFPQLNSEN